jgi:hypothetical protein
MLLSHVNRYRQQQGLHKEDICDGGELLWLQDGQQHLPHGHFHVRNFRSHVHL